MAVAAAAGADRRSFDAFGLRRLRKAPPEEGASGVRELLSGWGAAATAAAAVAAGSTGICGASGAAAGEGAPTGSDGVLGAGAGDGSGFAAGGGGGVARLAPPRLGALSLTPRRRAKPAAGALRDGGAEKSTLREGSDRGAADGSA